MCNKDIIEGIQGIVNVEGHSGSIRFIGLLDGVGMFQQIRFYLYETEYVFYQCYPWPSVIELTEQQRRDIVNLLGDNGMVSVSDDEYV